MKQLKLLLFLILFCNLSFGQTVFNVNGTSSVIGQGSYEITPNTSNISGSMFSTTTINLNNPFDLKFGVINGTGGADGMAFVLQNTGSTAVGNIGSSLGFGYFYAAGPGSGEITPSLAIEIDIFNNGVTNTADIPEDHLAIVTNGNIPAPTYAPVFALPSGANINDGVCRQLRVVWDPSTTNLQVYFDGNLRYSVTYDIINNIFGGNPMVYYGITGSTGGASTQQIICHQFAGGGNDTSACENSSIALQASGGTSYSWQDQFGATNGFSNPNVATPTFTPYLPLTTWPLYVTVTNAYGCTETDTVVLTFDALPSNASAGTDQNLCNTNTTTLAGNTPSSGTGTWTVLSGGATVNNPGSPTSIVNGLTTGINEFVWTISNGSCPSESDTVVVNVDAPPSTANAGTDQQLCALSTTALSANTPATGNGQWSVLTGGATVTIPSSPSSNVTNLGTGSNQFIWTVTNGVCPASEDTVEIVVYATPSTANAGSDQVICNSSITTMSATTPDTGNGVWSLISGSGNFGNNSDPVSSVTALNTGGNAFLWTVSNGVCPVSEDTVWIWTSQISANAGTDSALCQGGSVVLGGSPTATGGLGNYSYLWSPGTGLNDSTTANPLALAIDTTVYTVVVSDSLGCADSASVSLFVQTSPNTSLTGTNISCNGSGDGSIYVTVSGSQSPFTYSWSTGDTTQIIDSLSQGYYYLTVTDNTGCSTVDSAQIIEPGALTISINPDRFICDGNSALLYAIPTGGSAPFTYQWSCNQSDCALNNNTSDNPEASPAAGTVLYIVTVTDANSCSAIPDSCYVTVLSNPTVSAGNDQSIYSGSPAQLSATGTNINSYAWGPASGNITGATAASTEAYPITTTVFVVTVTSNDGCQATDSVLVTVETQLNIPSAFSPNNDGKNDSWEIDGLNTGYPNCHMEVYNRWGVRLYESDGYTLPWDGSYNGLPVPFATYYYVLDLGNGADPISGTVTLFR